MSKFLLLCGLGLLLAACTPPEPTMFGMPIPQWKMLTPAEKQQVIKGYNERQKINARNAPIEGVINTAGAAVQQQQRLKALEKTNNPMLIN